MKASGPFSVLLTTTSALAAATGQFPHNTTSTSSISASSTTKNIFQQAFDAIESVIPIYTNVYSYLTTTSSESPTPAFTIGPAGLLSAGLGHLSKEIPTEIPLSSLFNSNLLVPTAVTGSRSVGMGMGIGKVTGTGRAAMSVSQSCTTIYAPYANATISHKRQLSTGRPAKSIATASGAHITAALVSTVICKPVTYTLPSNTSTATTEAAQDVFYGTSASMYTYPNGQVCTMLPAGQAAIVISYYHEPESTITFVGNRSEYTAPYQTPVQPTWCNFMLTPTPMASKTGGYLLSVASSMSTYDILGSQTTSTVYAVDHNPSVIFVSSESTVNYGATQTGEIVNNHASAEAVADDNGSFGIQAVPGHDEDSNALVNAAKPSTLTSTSAAVEETTTSSSSSTWFLTLQTNPAQAIPQLTPTTSSTLTPSNPASTATSFAITAGINQVVINANTYSNLGSKTTTVTQGSATFTIDPSLIVQSAGPTVTRLVSDATGLAADLSTSTVLAGLDVAVTQGTVQLGDFIYTIGSTKSTEVVMGKTATIGPEGITVAAAKTSASLTYSASAPSQTEILVAGGQMITACGTDVIVIHKSSITYATLKSPLTSTIAGTTLTINSNGVTVDASTTLGGPSAAPSANQYAMVGGATLTQIGESILIVDSSTFTVGPSATTTAILTVAGVIVTVDPKGIAAGTVSIDYPFGPSVTTTIYSSSATGAGVVAGETEKAGVKGQATVATATAKATETGNSKDRGAMVRVDWRLVLGILTLWMVI